MGQYEKWSNHCSISFWFSYRPTSKYGAIWSNMESGATMICLHLEPDWRLSISRNSHGQRENGKYGAIWSNMETGATISPLFVYIWNQFEGCLCLGIHRWYLFDFWGKLWVCMHGWGGRNWNYHWKDSRAHQHLPKPSRRLRLMLLTSPTYIDTVSDFWSYQFI